MRIPGEEESGQAMLMLGAGEAGTSCAMDHFPSVPGMAYHMTKSHCFVAASR